LAMVSSRPTTRRLRISTSLGNASDANDMRRSVAYSCSSVCLPLQKKSTPRALVARCAAAFSSRCPRAA
jgi:hypothetical protein